MIEALSDPARAAHDGALTLAEAILMAQAAPSMLELRPPSAAGDALPATLALGHTSSNRSTGSAFYSNTLRSASNATLSNSGNVSLSSFFKRAISLGSLRSLSRLEFQARLLLSPALISAPRPLKSVALGNTMV